MAFSFMRDYAGANVPQIAIHCNVFPPVEFQKIRSVLSVVILLVYTNLQNARAKEKFMIKELVCDPAILSISCEKAQAEDEPIANDLVETLQSIEDAACLAANQIGETKRIIAFKDENDTIHVMYNPSINQALRPAKLPEECLSLPNDDPKIVRRFDWVRIEYDQLINGELVTKKRTFEGWTAEIIQHMIDHCNGKLV